MADKPQKTQLLTDAPPEVQAAIDRQSNSNAPQQGQSTVMLDAPNVSAQQPQAGARPVVVPTMMKERPEGSLPPVRAKKQSTAGRWIAGPLIAIVVAGGTAAVAGVVMPVKPKVVVAPKVSGKLMLTTEPAGASVTIDGKPFPHFTPTEVTADVGSTVRIGLKLDGYAAKDEEVIVASGERPMNFTLEKAAPPPAPVVPAPAAPVGKHEHDHDHEHHHDVAAKAPKDAVGGKGTISVFVRPWAIVYVDGTRLRQTPVQTYELPAGKHVLELVNDPKGKREKMLITLKPGEAQEIKKDWDK